MSIQFDSLTTFVLVFVRMVSMIVFNPVITRRNVPTRVTMGLSLLITILVAGTVPPVENITPLDVTFLLLSEIIVGFMCGYVFRLFYYMLYFAGDMLDMQFGLAMSKVFDPSSSIQVSLSGRVLEILFILYFFSTGSHLILIRIFATSYKIIPIGLGINILEASSFVVQVFLSAFSLIMRLIIPFIVTEFILEVSMGVLMRLIPQIHIFVINIQLKVLLGIILLFLFASPITNFMDRYMVILLETTQKILYSLK